MSNCNTVFGNHLKNFVYVTNLTYNLVRLPPFLSSQFLEIGLVFMISFNFVKLLSGFKVETIKPGTFRGVYSISVQPMFPPFHYNLVYLSLLKI